jgi:hypothetical protein
VAAFLADAFDSRCGRTAALDRVAEVIVLMVLRRAIDAGTTESGLLAALAHPSLHRALVLIHDMPSRAWRVDLALEAGLSPVTSWRCSTRSSTRLQWATSRLGA